MNQLFSNILAVDFFFPTKSDIEIKNIKQNKATSESRIAVGKGGCRAWALPLRPPSQAPGGGAYNSP